MEFCPYPVAYGNEEETSLGHLRVGKRPGSDLDGDELKGVLDAYRLDAYDDVRIVDKMTTAGSGIYVDRHHLELCTAECPTIEEAAERIQVNEEILRIAVGGHLLRSEDQSPRPIGIFRRVIDNKLHTYGCHDNFGYAKLTVEQREMVKPVLIGHLATRSFVTGAGYVGTHGPRFAQKAEMVSSTSTYSYVDSMFRFTEEDGGTRVETRCNDVNISPWAIRMRMGATAMALTIGLTPLGSELLAINREQARLRAESHHMPRLYNELSFDDNGIMQSTDHIHDAVRFQRDMAVLFQSDKMRAAAGPQPKELMILAKELEQYCDDFEQVLAGKAQLRLLSDRADWAAKFELIWKKITRDRTHPTTPKHREMGDIICQRQDLEYAYSQLERVQLPAQDEDDEPKADKYQIAETRKGDGQTLRDRFKRFRMPLDPERVAHARIMPPAGGRAAARAYLLRNYTAVHAYWSMVFVAMKGAKIDHWSTDDTTGTIGIAMPNVRKSRLSRTSRRLLQDHAVRRAEPFRARNHS